MKQFDGIEKKMPYKESKDYIDGLIDSCADKAVEQQSRNLHPRFVRNIIISTAAAAAVFGGVWFAIPQESEQDRIFKKVENSQSLDEVLNSLDSEQLESLNDYTTDDIPEY